MHHLSLSASFTSKRAAHSAPRIIFPAFSGPARLGQYIFIIGSLPHRVNQKSAKTVDFSENRPTGIPEEPCF
jgi:hypothetical protein